MYKKVQRYYFSQYVTCLFHPGFGMKKAEKQETDNSDLGLN